MGLLVAVVACSAGCFSISPAGCVPSCPLPDGRAFDASTVGTLACDLPSSPDASAVIDLASFRAQASAAVCDWSLRCDWGLFEVGDSFCHPSFAALDGARHGTPPFDLATARTCVAQLASAADCEGALAVAMSCHDLSAGHGRAFSGEGSGCIASHASPCDFGLACVGGVCTATVGLGAACDASHPCSSGPICQGGACVFAQFGDVCDVLPCGPGLQCRTCLGGTPGQQCVGGLFTPARHHIGCGCTTDAGCPTDVATCTGGVCTLRPFVGDACSAGGPPCFGSRCDASGTCVLFGLGEGPCGDDTDCVSGSVCVANPAVAFTTICGRALALGEACDGSVVGRCVEGCCDGATCVAHAARGGVCNVACGCEPGLTCSSTTGRCF